jgi:hypothetical protein
LCGLSEVYLDPALFDRERAKISCPPWQYYNAKKLAEIRGTRPEAKRLFGLLRIFAGGLRHGRAVSPAAPSP